MDKLPRMNRHQLSMIRKLIRSRCANYDQGNCLVLDDEEECICPQYWAYSLLCKYFRSAVLPNDPELEEEILSSFPNKVCDVCGLKFFSSSNRAKYCPNCSAKVRKRKETQRLHQLYLKSRI